jgi:hypothetical protein
MYTIIFFIQGLLAQILHAQYVQQGPILVGTGYSATPLQGYGVGISYDGNTLAWGGTGDQSSVGSAWVFTRSNAIWSPQGSLLTGSDIVGTANFGTSISFSADGDTLAVGGAGDNSNVGATWLFTRLNDVWTQLGNKLVGSGSTAGDVNQGFSTCMSADGSLLVVAGNSDNNGMGAVWLFTKNATGYFQLGSKLLPSDNVGSVQFGQSVACSSDGSTIAIGGPNDNASVGATWIFVKNTTSGHYYQQGAKLIGTGATFSAPQQGWSVSLSSDGNTVAFGAPYDGTSGYIGAVWIFKRSGSTWVQYRDKLVASDIGPTYATQAGVGYSVGLSGNGLRLAVGGPLDSGAIGATWIFIQNSTGDFSQQGSKLLGNGSTVGSTEFGYSLAMSNDGSTVAVGGPTDNNGVGGIWAFTYASSPSVSPTTFTAAPTHTSSAGRLVVDTLVYSWCLMSLATIFI